MDFILTTKAQQNCIHAIFLLVYGYVLYLKFVLTPQNSQRYAHYIESNLETL